MGKIVHMAPTMRPLRSVIMHIPVVGLVMINVYTIFEFPNFTLVMGNIDSN